LGRQQAPQPAVTALAPGRQVQVASPSRLHSRARGTALGLGRKARHSRSPRLSPGGTQALLLARHDSGLPQSHSSPAQRSTRPSPHWPAGTVSRQWLSPGLARLSATAAAVQFDTRSLFRFTPDEENRLIRNLKNSNDYKEAKA
jgi:hypothetical protein